MRGVLAIVATIAVSVLFSLTALARPYPVCVPPYC